MKWKCLLTSGEIIEDTNQPDSWNKLTSYCKKNHLTIREFYINNERIQADGYFTLYDMMVIGILSPNPIQIVKKGIGYYFHQHNRSRICWFNPSNGEELVGQVFKPIPDIHLEISILDEKNPGK